MNELIKVEIEKARNVIIANKSVTSVADDRAFSYALLKNYFDVQNFHDQDDLVTDGANDGGIDFLYYDDDETKLYLCQAKCTETLSYEDIGNEFDKMNSTVINFRCGNTGSYNDRLKKALQNAIDRLPEDSQDNIVYHLYTTAEVDVDKAIKKLNITTHDFVVDIVSIYQESDIASQIQDNQERLEIVEYEKINIDKPKNILEYETDDTQGIMVNVLSTSLVKLYNKYSSKGLFDLNIRKYISNKMVDSGINNTLDVCRGDFWFLNNGIIIACEEFAVDGNAIKLYGFSIVNGGQTTTLIGKYKGDNKQEFSIPCKIIARKDNSRKDSPKKRDDSMKFFTRIAEATNSQKPIMPRDLKSNSPEMIRLSRSLANEKIYLEIKRGVRKPANMDYSIRNDEFGQLILSFVMQRPGTSRTQKKQIFANSDLYGRIFKENYDKNAEKKAFIIDLIKLNERYKNIENELTESGLSDDEVDVMKNGKQILFALLGVLYRIANGDVTEKDLTNDINVVKNTTFTYGSFISNYTKDDLDTKLKCIITYLIQIMAESYLIAKETKLTTSVSNLFKTDAKYMDYILPKFKNYLPMIPGKEIKDKMDIFKRKIKV